VDALRRERLRRFREPASPDFVNACSERQLRRFRERLRRAPAAPISWTGFAGFRGRLRRATRVHVIGRSPFTGFVTRFSENGISNSWLPRTRPPESSK